MYRVVQTKGIEFGLKAIHHNHIREFEEAVELAKRVGAKTVDKSYGMCYGTELWVPIWYNEETKK